MFVVFCICFKPDLYSCPFSAGFAGAFIDREFETHGVRHLPKFYPTTNIDYYRLNEQLDFIDKQKAKNQGEH